MHMLILRNYDLLFEQFHKNMVYLLFEQFHKNIMVYHENVVDELTSMRLT